MLQGKSLQDLVEKYCAFKEMEERTPRSIKNIREQLGRLLRWLREREFNETTALEYINSQSHWSKSTRVTETKRINAFANWLYQRKYLTEIFKLPFPSAKKLQLSTREEQIPDVRLLEADIIAGTQPGKGDNSRNEAIKAETREALQFMLRTGVRVGELLGLRRDYFHLESTIPMLEVLGKGNKWRKIPIPLDMIEKLKVRILKNEISYDVTRETLNTALKRGAVINKRTYANTIHNHLLRKAFGRELALRGTPIKIIQQILGHEDADITLKYYQGMDDQNLFEAVNTRHILVAQNMPDDVLFSMIKKGMDELMSPIEKRYRVNTTTDPKTGEIVYRILKNQGLTGAI